MATTCSQRGEYKHTDSMTESARARWRARYSYFSMTMHLKEKYNIKKLLNKTNLPRIYRLIHLFQNIRNFVISYSQSYRKAWA